MQVVEDAIVVNTVGVIDVELSSNVGVWGLVTEKVEESVEVKIEVTTE